MIKRTLTTYKVKAIQLDYKDGQAVADVIGEIEMVGNSISATEARKAFATNGIDVPRGCKIEFTELESILYGCTTEQFLSVAKPIEVKNDDDSDE